MPKVIISPKYQVVIPKEVRESLNLKPGMRVEMIRFGNNVHMVFLKDMKSMRGALKVSGANTDPEREKIDREI